MIKPNYLLNFSSLVCLKKEKKLFKKFLTKTIYLRIMENSEFMIFSKVCECTSHVIIVCYVSFNFEVNAADNKQRDPAMGCVKITIDA